jgi:nucleotide-binding universal stress UspA family protein
MYRRILVPLDGSVAAEAALPAAEWLSAASGAPMALLSAAEGEDVADARRYLSGTSARLVNGSEELVVQGDPAGALVNEAAAHPLTLIAMSAHGWSGSGRHVLGSVASKTAQAARSPVLLIRGSELPSTVIVALDGSPMAEVILPHITALAAATGLPILLFRVVSLTVAGFCVDGHAQVPLAILQKEESEADAYVRGIAERLREAGAAEVQVRVTLGIPYTDVLEAARHLPGSMLALSAHGRSGLGRWALGSVAERVVLHANTHVLLVHP